MIQRIQSLYLFLTTLLSLLLFEGSFLSFTEKSGSVLNVTFNAILRNTGSTGFEPVEKLIPLSVLIILIPVFSLVTIFLYKNRKIQMRLALSVIILIAGFVLLSIYYTSVICLKYNAQIVPGYKMFIPLLLIVFNYLAYKGIKKDEDLVRSYDRLR
jgi:hypothetical protein